MLANTLGSSSFCAFGAPGADCPPQPLPHSLSIRDCYLLEMADRKSLIPSDIACSSYLVYHSDSHLSWTNINNYTVPVVLIIVAPVPRYVFCCCQEMGIEMSSVLFFFFSHSFRFSDISDVDQIIRRVQHILFMLTRIFDNTIKLGGVWFLLYPQKKEKEGYAIMFNKILQVPESENVTLLFQVCMVHFWPKQLRIWILLLKSIYAEWNV